MNYLTEKIKNVLLMKCVFIYIIILNQNNDFFRNIIKVTTRYWTI